jgi:hypothetical protein
MARFRYLGEDASRKPMKHGSLKRAVASWGPTVAIRFHMGYGKKLEIKPPNGKEFKIGEDIGYEVEDLRVIRHLQADPRFQEIR